MHHHPNLQLRWISAHLMSVLEIIVCIFILENLMGSAFMNEEQCTSLIAAITHCLAGNFYHAFWGLEERSKLLNMSKSISTLAV